MKFSSADMATTLAKIQSKLKFCTLSKRIIKQMRKQSKGKHTEICSDSTYKCQRVLFLEGHRLVLDALQAGLLPSEVFLSEKAVAAPLGMELLCALLAMQKQQSRDHQNYNQHKYESDSMHGDDNSPRIYWVAAEIMSSLSATNSSQGVFASVPHTDSSISIFSSNPDCQIPATTPSSLVVCDGISDPGNLGTIIRTSYSLGVEGIVVVAGCSPWVSLLTSCLLVYNIMR